MNPDGSAQRQLSSELSPVTGYAVAPDGRSYLVGDGAVLVLQSADGSERSVADARRTPSSTTPPGRRTARASPLGGATGDGRGPGPLAARRGWRRRHAPGDARRAVARRQRPAPADRGRAPARRVPARPTLLARRRRARLPRHGRSGGRARAARQPVDDRRIRGRRAAGLAARLDRGAGQRRGRRPRSTPRRRVNPYRSCSRRPSGSPAGRLAALHIGQLDRGAQRVLQLALPDRSTRPAVNRDQLLFVVADPGSAGTGGATVAGPGLFGPAHRSPSAGRRRTARRVRRVRGRRHVRWSLLARGGRHLAGGRHHRRGDAA